MLGDNIRKYREAVGLSQTQLAYRLGTSAAHISRMEHGKTKPGSETMVHLADALSVSPNELLGWEDRAAAGSVSTGTEG